MRDYLDRWVTPLKRVTSPTWGPPHPCKQALSDLEMRDQTKKDVARLKMQKKKTLKALN